ncbi:MAG: hypothetical protein OEV00_12735, partial [Acidobacteriota bacterium]|nr:hypothetical protein [Acidobacteriota bacterium]
MTLSAFSASLRRHAWLAGLGLLALVATHRLIAYDVWWQLAAGRWILDHGLPTHDPFSYAFPGRPWIELRWLYCVVLELIYRVAGVHGLIVAKLLAVLAAAWLWLRAAGATTSAAARGLGALVLLLAVHDRLTIRPELATFVLLGLTVWLLRSGEAAGDRRSGWLVPIQILWCNLHTLAILGPIVQTLHVVTTRREGRWDRRGLVIAVLSWLALLATPYGFRGAAFPFQLWSQIRSGHYLDRVIGEFHGPLSELWFRADPRTIGFLLCVGVSAASFALVPWRRSLFRIGLWVVFLYLGLQAVRNVALFGWVAGFVTVANVAAWEATASEGRRRRVDRVVTTVCWLALLIGAPLIVSGEWARRNHSDKQFGVGISDRRFPIEAWSFIEQAKLPRPIVHGLGDGGYLA